MKEFKIRNYNPDDEDAVIKVTFKTGFKGEDMAGRGFCNDTRLWFMLFTGYYALYEPEHFFVVAKSNTGVPVGFICGSPDTIVQESQFRKQMIPRIALRFFGYTSWRYPRCFVNIFSMMRNYLSGTENVENDPIIAQYPAHLHINLLPDYQSHGLGTQLIRHFETHLQRLGVKGIHLGTTNKNQKAVPFYHKMGFEIVHDSGIVSHKDFDDLRYLMFAKTLKSPSQ